MGGWGQGCELYCIARASHEMDHEIHQEAERIGELQQLELTTYTLKFSPCIHYRRAYQDFSLRLDVFSVSCHSYYAPINC